MPGDMLSHEEFEPHIGTAFAVADGERLVDARLSEVRAMPKYAGPAALRTPFSLLFRAPEQHIMPQGIYRLSHAAMGDLDIFIVPIGRDADGVTYEASFN